LRLQRAELPAVVFT